MKYLAVLFFALYVQIGFGQMFPSGKVLEGEVIASRYLGNQVRYSIYLPPGYDISERKYPVVYLLHGYTDDDTGWLQFGEVHMAADRAIAEREIPPMVIVMPDAGLSYYANDHQREQPWEDFFIEEFIPMIESKYRVRAKKEFRGIAGLSMGGYGTLLYAMHHPDKFCAAAALSAAVRSDEHMMALSQERFDRTFGHLYGKGLEGKDRLTEHWKANSILEMAQYLPDDSLKQTRWYMDCGDGDYLAPGNSLLHIAFLERGIPHEYRVRDGAHNWTYWRTGIVPALKFIGESFHR